MIIWEKLNRTIAFDDCVAVKVWRGKSGLALGERCTDDLLSTSVKILIAWTAFLFTKFC